MDPTQLYNLMRDPGLAPADQAILAATAAPEGATYGDGPLAMPQETPVTPVTGVMNDFIEPEYRKEPEKTVKSGESKSASQSVSAKGYSPSKNEQIRKGPGAALDQKLAGIKSGIDQEYAGYEQRSDEATQNAISAEDQITQITQERIKEQTKGKQYMADIQSLYNVREKAAWETARVESAKAFADYKAAQQAFAATSINPNAMFEEAGGFNRFGMGVAAFAHDFLGAKGIKTSAMDTLNGAIKRNIDAQIQNMQHKGQVAQGFKEIWDMQRAMSASDAEARQRMHGFALKAAEMSIDAYLGQYDSKLAGAKGLAAKALIQRQAIQEDMKLQKMIDDKYIHLAGQEIQRHGQELSASASMYAASVSRKNAQDHIALERDKMNKKAAIDLSSLGAPIYDQTESGKGKFIGRIKPEFAKNEKLAENIAFKNLSTIRAARMIKEIEKLQATAPRSPFPVPEFLRDEITRRSKALRYELLNSLLYDASGKAINEKEFARHEQTLPENFDFQDENGKKILYQKMDQILQQNTAMIRQFVDKPGKDDPRLGEEVDLEVGGPEQLNANLISGGAEDKANDETDPNNAVLNTDYTLRLKGSEGGFRGKSAKDTSAFTAMGFETFKNSSFNTPGEGGKPTKAFEAVDNLVKKAATDPKALEKVVSFLDGQPEADLKPEESHKTSAYTNFLLSRNPDILIKALDMLKPGAYADVIKTQTYDEDGNPLTVGPQKYSVSPDLIRQYELLKAQGK